MWAKYGKSYITFRLHFAANCMWQCGHTLQSGGLVGDDDFDPSAGPATFLPVYFLHRSQWCPQCHPTAAPQATTTEVPRAMRGRMKHNLAAARGSGGIAPQKKCGPADGPKSPSPTRDPQFCKRQLCLNCTAVALHFVVGIRVVLGDHHACRIMSWSFHHACRGVPMVSLPVPVDDDVTNAGPRSAHLGA